MSEKQAQVRDADVAALYAEAAHWQVNTGKEAIHAKRMPGTWRTVKWFAAAVWLIYFLGPYIRLGDRQAVIFDIPHRQFHIFGITILPQDFWMLSLTLLFFAILLAIATALAGRIWCGFFCFQTVWTDVFTWIEEKIEGNPQKRRKLDQAPLDAAKVGRKAVKHLLWGIIGVLTGIGFASWFTDAYQLWGDLFSLKASSTAYIVVGMFTVGTYVLAGFLREQACFWLCPYARIQGVMVDATTLLPTYDFKRGEPRGRVKKGQTEANRTNGDCVDCNQCVAVCPTGVDIRHGQQEGCITCALCIDACNSVMDKVGRPRGLIRYASLDQIEGREVRSLLMRPRVWLYGSILSAALIGIGVGLSTLDAVEIKVLHERQPLFVQLSDGSIHNKYFLKILNKMTEDMTIKISATGPRNLEVIGLDENFVAVKGGVSPVTVYVKVPAADVSAETMTINFKIEAQAKSGQHYSSTRNSIFISPQS